MLTILEQGFRSRFQITRQYLLKKFFFSHWSAQIVMSATRFQDGAILYCRLKGIVSAKIDKLKVYFAEQMDLVAEC